MHSPAFLAVAATLLVVVLTTVVAHPFGATREACRTMRARHGRLGLYRHFSRFKLRQSQRDFSAGNPVTVNLTAPPGTKFKGFLIRAFVDGQDRGAFRPGDDCKPVRGCNAFVTHVNPSYKEHVTLLWDPPAKNGTVDFKATVVMDFATYFTDIWSWLDDENAPTFEGI
ncbi:ferric-chelate reductase 1-like [Haemaphysalis longicornis]